MSNLYTTKTAVQNYLQKTLAASFDAQLTAYIAAMSEYCDSVACYPLYRTTETTRIYDGSGLTVQRIDAVHTITDVLVDSVVASPLEVPYNSDIKTELKLTTGGFTVGSANVSVKGIHCLKKALPAQLTHACSVFVGIILNQVKDQRGGVKSEKIGEYSVSYMSDQERLDYKMAMEIVKSYRPITF